jgi:uncharacterized membrane protein
MMPRPPGDAGKSTTGLDEPLAGALTYVLGFITGVTFLVIEKDSAFVRFHARQSTMTFAAVLVLDLILWALPLVGWILIPVFTVGVVILWAWLMFKAVTGHRYKLPYIGEMAERQTQPR